MDARNECLELYMLYMIIILCVYLKLFILKLWARFLRGSIEWEKSIHDSILELSSFSPSINPILRQTVQVLTIPSYEMISKFKNFSLAPRPTTTFF